jgi:hypothetical protein
MMCGKTYFLHVHLLVVILHKFNTVSLFRSVNCCFRLKYANDTSAYQILKKYFSNITAEKIVDVRGLLIYLMLE